MNNLNTPISINQDSIDKFVDNFKVKQIEDYNDNDRHLFMTFKIMNKMARINLVTPEAGSMALGYFTIINNSIIQKVQNIDSNVARWTVNVLLKLLEKSKTISPNKDMRLGNILDNCDNDFLEMLIRGAT